MRHIKRIYEWSGDEFGRNSKVSVGGKLMTVYHGTYGSFKRFDAAYMGRTDEGFYGRGFYFTADKEYALEYGNRAMECNLDIQSPFYLTTWSTLGSYLELDLRDDLSALNGGPKDMKTDRKIPDGYFLKRWEHEVDNMQVVSFCVYPKKELYGTDKEEYGPEVTVTKDALKSERDERGYSDKAIVGFTDRLNGVEYDEGLANWLLQRLDRWNFHELLKKNGYDGIFVVGEKREKTPVDEVSEFIVWDADQIKILDPEK